jgi:hypothetical protein
MYQVVQKQRTILSKASIFALLLTFKIRAHIFNTVAFGFEKMASFAVREWRCAA